MSPSEWIADLQRPDRVVAEAAARRLRELSRCDPSALAGFEKDLLRLAFAAEDLGVCWNLLQIVGRLKLCARQRAAAVDWLFERLRDASPLTRTFALQALADMGKDDARLRKRVRVVAEEFAENGTAAMRARARKILKQLG